MIIEDWRGGDPDGVNKYFSNDESLMVRVKKNQTIPVLRYFKLLIGHAVLVQLLLLLPILTLSLKIQIPYHPLLRTRVIQHEWSSNQTSRHNPNIIKHASRQHQHFRAHSIVQKQRTSHTLKKKKKKTLPNPSTPSEQTNARAHIRTHEKRLTLPAQSKVPLTHSRFRVCLCSLFLLERDARARKIRFADRFPQRPVPDYSGAHGGGQGSTRLRHALSLLKTRRLRRACGALAPRGEESGAPCCCCSRIVWITRWFARDCDKWMRSMRSVWRS